MPPTITCPKCANSAPSTFEFTAGSRTVTCRTCGHSLQTDQNGASHLPPENPEDLRTTPASDPLFYPVGLACTLVQIHEYPTGTRIRPLTITPPEPSETYTFFVYHQPFREPQLSFRDVRHRGSSDARYIYAAEMAPYDPDIAVPTAKHNRRLKNLLLQEASRLSGFTLKETRHPWPIPPKAPSWQHPWFLRANQRHRISLLGEGPSPTAAFSFRLFPLLALSLAVPACSHHRPDPRHPWLCNLPVKNDHE